MAGTTSPLVGVIMGSKSDWETMRAAADVLAEFGAVEFCIGATLVGSSDGTFGIPCCVGIYAVGGLFE